jgi:hypothetical protein
MLGELTQTTAPATQGTIEGCLEFRAYKDNIPIILQIILRYNFKITADKKKNMKKRPHNIS